MHFRIRQFLKAKVFILFVLFMAVAGCSIYKYGSETKAAGGHVHDMSAECGQENAVIFTEWTDTDRLPDGEGSYFLRTDVTLTETWTMSSGTINLCLNGHQIKLAEGARAQESILKLSGGAVLNLCDCSAEGTGSINGDGGSNAGIYMDSNSIFNMHGGKIKGNEGFPNPSAHYGGGIHVESGEVHLYGGSITENKARYGGGIYAVSSKIVMHTEKAVISNNQSQYKFSGSSSGEGGGIYMKESFLCLEEGTISGNSAGVFGGGVCAKADSEIQINGGTVSDNTAQHGSGIYAVEGKTLLLKGGNILRNQRATTGGGLYLYKNDLTMSGGLIAENKCCDSIGMTGGGIEVRESHFIMSGGEIKGNSSEGAAGGVHINSGSVFDMTDGCISNNKAQSRGGGMLISNSSTQVKLSHKAKIQNNEVGCYGGGICIEEGTLNMTGGEISGNKVVDRNDPYFNGGGIYVKYKDVGDKEGGVCILSGSPVIKDNERKDSPNNNIYLDVGKKITIGGKLETDPIGVTMMRPGVFTEGWEDNMSGQKVEEFFVSGDSQYDVGQFYGEDSYGEDSYGEGLLGYSLVYVKPEGALGTVPEKEVYSISFGTKVEIEENTLTKKGYKAVGWSETKDGTDLVSSPVTMNRSITLYPIFSRNFTGKNERIELETGEPINPIDLNQFVSFDEGVTETKKNFQFEISGTNSFPKGLKLESGSISGIPEEIGQTEVTITARDLALAENGQSRTFTLTIVVKVGKLTGTGSVTQKDLHCGEIPAPVPESATNGTDHVTYYYKLAEAADTEYTKEVPGEAGEYTVRAVFEETDTYKKVTANAQFTISHKYGEEWEKDGDSHWHKCTCGARKDKEVHKEDKGRVTKEPSMKEPGERTFKCSVCGRILRTEEIEKLPKLSGTGSVTQKDLHCGEIPAPMPESATNGTDHVTYYYKLAEAADTEYTKEVPGEAGEYTVRAVFEETDTYKKVTANAQFTISHKYGEEWEKDGDSHWHKCICGARKDKEAHKEDKGTVTKEPSVKEPGERTFRCNVCGCILRTEEIPIINTGNLEKEIQLGDNVPDIRVPVSLEKLADIVLTQEEQESVVKGADIKIILTVMDAEHLVSSEEKNILQAALNGFEKGQYLDISLFKQIDGIQHSIVKTNGKIRIVLEIPEYLRGNAKNKRTFAVIQIHDGKAGWLTDLDSDADTITMEIDCFSTYVLVYQEDKADNNKPDDSKPDDSKPDDNKPNDNKPDDNKKDDGSKDDNKPDGNKKDNKKPDDNTADTDGGNAGGVKDTTGDTQKNEAVNAGDSGKTALWLAVGVLSGAACLLLDSGIRKRRESRK